MFNRLWICSIDWLPLTQCHQYIQAKVHYTTWCSYFVCSHHASALPRCNLSQLRLYSNSKGESNPLTLHLRYISSNCISLQLGGFSIRLLTLCLGQKMSGIVSWTHAAATQKLTYCHAKPLLLPRCTFTAAMLHLYDCHTESLATATLNLHYCHVESLSTATLNLHYCHAESLITATANLHYCHAEPLLTTAPHNSGQVCKYT